MDRFIIRETVMSPKPGAVRSIQKNITISSQYWSGGEGIISVNTEKGYVLLDSLAAFSIILFASLVLLPLFIHIETDRLDVRREIKAYHILFEDLERHLHGAPIEENKRVKELAGTFTTSIRPHPIKPDYMEGCVSYENSKKHNMSVCEIIKR